MSDRDTTIDIAYGFAKFMRYNALEMAKNAGKAGSHIGGGFSAIDIIATLYGGVLRYDKDHPDWEGRDRFITSKRHCYLASYTALLKAGMITKEQLLTYHSDGGTLAGYPWLPQFGMDFSGGSLGMGLSVGIGMALTAKRRKADHNIYVLLGDGECNEGAIWEGFMSATKYRLDNLIAIIDYNKMQFDGANNEIMSVAPLLQKLEAFGWDCTEVNGHSIEALYDALSADKQTGKPKAIIADTIKGYGLPSVANKAESHHCILSEDDYQYMMNELKEGAYDRV